MNSQILFATMTGHSRKIAQEIAKQTGCPLHDLKSDPIIPSCRRLYIVSGIYSGECKPELLSYVSKLTPSQIGKAVLIISSVKGGYKGSLRTRLEQAGILVDAKEFLCRGSFLWMGIGHPNRSEISAAAEFVQKMEKE